MTIVVEIRPEVQAEIARQAALQGRAVEAHAAGARIRELSRGLSLGGLTIRALIDEGRR